MSNVKTWQETTGVQYPSGSWSESAISYKKSLEIGELRDTLEEQTKREGVLVAALKEILDYCTEDSDGHAQWLQVIAKKALEELFPLGNLHSAKASGVGL